MFITTKDTYGENRKAEVKNHNLPILQEMYFGSKEKILECVFSRQPAFKKFPCLVQNKSLNRFTIEFNHIRQYQSGNRASGISLDKGQYAPSDIFRTNRLDSPKYVKELIEFMTMIPVTKEVHSYISQSSAYGHITLKNYPKKNWPWHLKNKQNFDKFCKKYNLEFLDYDKFINHLCSINSPPIRERIQFNWDGPLKEWGNRFV